MKKSKRLIFAGFALALSMALSITSTYAWFIRGAAPVVEQFELSAIADTPDLYISLDQTAADSNLATGYTQKVETADFNAALLEAATAGKTGGSSVPALADIQLGAVTTTDGKEFKDEAGTTYSPNLGINDEAAYAKNGTYISLKIHFRSSTENFKVAVASTGTSLQQKVATVGHMKPVYAWKEFAAGFKKAPDGAGGIPSTETVSVNAGIYTSAIYALRFSFVDNGDSVATNQNKVGVWNPQASYKNIKDTRNGVSTHYIIDDAVGTTIVENFAETYRQRTLGVSTPAQTQAVIADNMTNAGELDQTKYIIDLGSTTDTGFSGGYFYGSVTMNLWIEGWDSSCLNTILGDTFLTQLTFTGAANGATHAGE